MITLFEEYISFTSFVKIWK